MMHGTVITILLFFQLVCGGGVKYIQKLSESSDPTSVGTRISSQFLSANPMSYAPSGYDGAKPHGWRRDLTYAIVSLWTNAIRFSELSGQDSLQTVLIRNFEPYYKKKAGDNHVDHSIFGALPMEMYLVTGNVRAKDCGLYYADHQWQAPDPKHPGGTGNKTYEEQLELLAEGYSPQTRLWIDDMYMLTFLQVQAYKVTSDTAYLSRTAREMVLYLDKLQQANGLFLHAPTAPFYWGRGNGWIAAGMAILLRYLPATNPFYERILEGYRQMMGTLLKYQRRSGLWGQLIDDRESWDETSGSAMFTFAFLEGVKAGVLPAKYAKAAGRAWIALCGNLDEYANLANVCIGTNQSDSRQHYLTRDKVNGDPHGQAAMMWIVNSLLEMKR